MPAGTPPNVAADVSLGRVLGDRYRLLAVVGSGASAQVFLAEDVSLRRRVAVKLLHPGLVHDERFRRRFRAEARAAANLSHPHLLAVYDWGDSDEAYLVTELLAGGSLRSMLDNEGHLSLSQALVVGLHAADGLAFAAARGFVHRDVKPANLLFGAEGRLRVADFGIARAVAEAAWTEPDGALIGTARYAAPEQASGRSVDGKADVYSLALTMIEAATGDVPVVESSALATMVARQETDVPVGDELGPLAPALRRAGRADPDTRPTAAELVTELSLAAAELSRPRKLPLAGLDRLTPAGPETRADTPPVVDDETGIMVLDDQPVIEFATSPASARSPAPAATVGVEPRSEGTPPADRPQADGGGRSRPPRIWPLGLLILLPLLAVAGWFAVGAVQEATTTPTHPVGTYVGRSVDDVAVDIELSNWTATVVDGRADGSFLGEVLEQTPAPGVEWEEGQSITLVASIGPELREMPDVIGLPVVEARIAISRANLDVGTVDSSVFDEEVTAGYVLAASSPAGTELESATVVDLVVSAGPEPRVIAPVVGREPGDVGAELTSQGLIPVPAEDFSETVAAGLVIRTEPPAGTSVSRGSTVGVVVSLGPPLIVVPDVTGQTAAEAAGALQAAGFVVIGTEGPPNADVLATDPPAGESHRKGTEVVIFTRR